MNFLSHFYLDQDAKDPAFILGLVLPDLLKNAKIATKFQLHKPDSASSIAPLISGWKRHIDVDAHFHSADFFESEVHSLFVVMQAELPKSMIRNSFLAHIAFELMLDHTLVIHKKVDIDYFYTSLENVSDKLIHDFFQVHQLQDIERFLAYLHRFISSKYLYSYGEVQNISYALIQICKRVWGDLHLPTGYEHALTQILKKYFKTLGMIYLDVFSSLKK